MAAATTHPCDYCKATLPLAAPRCPYCLMAYAQTPSGPKPLLPPVRPGGIVSSLDLGMEPAPNMGKFDVTQPGGSSTTRVQGGTLVHVAPGKSLTLSESRVRLRDGCIRAQMVALDHGAQIAVVARQERIGDISTQYTFEVLPSRKKVRITRTVSSPKQASGTNLLDWKECPAVGAVGQPSVLELRVMGPTLEAWVNGAGPFSVHDPVLGTGIFGVRLEHEEGQPAHMRRVHVSWMQILEVTA